MRSDGGGGMLIVKQPTKPYSSTLNFKSVLDTSSKARFTYLYSVTCHKKL